MIWMLGTHHNTTSKTPSQINRGGVLTPLEVKTSPVFIWGKRVHVIAVMAVAALGVGSQKAVTEWGHRRLAALWPLFPLLLSDPCTFTVSDPLLFFTPVPYTSMPPHLDFNLKFTYCGVSVVSPWTTQVFSTHKCRSRQPPFHFGEVGAISNAQKEQLMFHNL